MSPDEHPWVVDPSAHDPSADPPPTPREIPPPPKSVPIPYSYGMFWRFAKWKGGVPLAVVLVVCGLIIPRAGGLAAIGIFVLMAVFVWRTFSKAARDTRQWKAHVTAVKAVAADAQAAHDRAQTQAEDRGYYEQWIGAEPAVTGPYAAEDNGGAPV